MKSNQLPFFLPYEGARESKTSISRENKRSCKTNFIIKKKLNKMQALTFHQKFHFMAGMHANKMTWKESMIAIYIRCSFFFHFFSNLHYYLLILCRVKQFLLFVSILPWMLFCSHTHCISVAKIIHFFIYEHMRRNWVCFHFKCPKSCKKSKIIKSRNTVSSIRTTYNN